MVNVYAVAPGTLAYCQRIERKGMEAVAAQSKFLPYSPSLYDL
jgi:hypothetical protein